MCFYSSCQALGLRALRKHYWLSEGRSGFEIVDDVHRDPEPSSG